MNEYIPLLASEKELFKIIEQKYKAGALNSNFLLHDKECVEWPHKKLGHPVISFGGKKYNVRILIMEYVLGKKIQSHENVIAECTNIKCIRQGHLKIVKRRTKHLNFLEYVNSKIEKKVMVPGLSECWLWVGQLSYDNYPLGNLNGKSVRIHREMVILTNGPLPPGKNEVNHMCGCRGCVNPAHLEAVTPQENKDDVRRRGVLRGENSPTAKLSKTKIKKIKLMHQDGYTFADISRVMEISANAISRICKNLSWWHVELLASDNMEDLETKIKAEEQCKKELGARTIILEEINKIIGVIAECSNLGPIPQNHLLDLRNLIEKLINNYPVAQLAERPAKHSVVNFCPVWAVD